MKPLQALLRYMAELPIVPQDGEDERPANIGPSHQEIERLLPPPGSPAPAQPTAPQLLRAMNKARDKEIFTGRGSIAPRDAQDKFNAEVDGKSEKKAGKSDKKVGLGDKKVGKSEKDGLGDKKQDKNTKNARIRPRETMQVDVSSGDEDVPSAPKRPRYDPYATRPIRTHIPSLGEQAMETSKEMRSALAASRSAVNASISTAGAANKPAANKPATNKSTAKQSAVNKSAASTSTATSAADKFAAVKSAADQAVAKIVAERNGSKMTTAWGTAWGAVRDNSGPWQKTPSPPSADWGTGVWRAPSPFALYKASPFPYPNFDNTPEGEKAFWVLLHGSRPGVYHGFTAMSTYNPGIYPDHCALTEAEANAIFTRGVMAGLMYVDDF